MPKITIWQCTAAVFAMPVPDSSGGWQDLFKQARSCYSRVKPTADHYEVTEDQFRRMKETADGKYGSAGGYQSRFRKLLYGDPQGGLF